MKVLASVGAVTNEQAIRTSFIRTIEARVEPGVLKLNPLVFAAVMESTVIAPPEKGPH